MYPATVACFVVATYRVTVHSVFLAPAPAPSVDPSVFASRDIRFFPPTDNVIQLHRQKAESVNRHRTEPPEPDKGVA